ncbi:hypothetical protein COXBURSA331_A1267 [Coxiella burnetii RSA 331]|nr:hypothetical protein COXBURSA331_A1267 [Coxiella burnetii RSA 331]
MGRIILIYESPLPQAGEGRFFGRSLKNRRFNPNSMKLFS